MEKYPSLNSSFTEVQNFSCLPSNSNASLCVPRRVVGGVFSIGCITATTRLNDVIASTNSILS